MIDRYQLRYREGHRSMLIDQELQADPKLVAIERDSMRTWEAPNDKDRLDEGDRDRIFANMGRAFASRGYALMYLDWPEDGDLANRSRDIRAR